ncbi:MULTISPECIES: hypothetical protein [Nostocales]|nr:MULTISPECIES: hypothetical protein [Nostocales]
MSVIVDTSVWSLALHRRTPPDSSRAMAQSARLRRSQYCRI